jgi:hypothetical protein
VLDLKRPVWAGRVLSPRNRLPAGGFGDTKTDEWPTLTSALLPRVAGDNDLVKRLLWSGLVAGIGALAAIVANRVAATVWRRVFDEDPPD